MATAPGNKRPRNNSTSAVEHSKHPKGPDLYLTLPSPTSRFITLNFQLCRFKRVFRIVRVPLNYTFANLHTLIQFLFGWSDSHAHAAEVYDNVELYKTKKGEIKNCGRPHRIELEMYNERVAAGHDAYRPRGNYPIWRVSTRAGNGYGFGDYEEKLDWEVTLNQVWNRNEEQNASFANEGDSPNEDIAIKYTYDFGASWEVHISTHEQDVFWKRGEPSNLPLIVKANGAVRNCFASFPNPATHFGG
ncbi:hypothetical protein OF83DRAFT_657740 [Amylostereum chailletii]|nr:hypothetical protein OF83DRAFT_657740 [Amylostereum chailletii]